MAKGIVYYVLSLRHARVAQLVERDLAKVEAAGSSPVSRSFILSEGRTSVKDVRLFSSCFYLGIYTPGFSHKLFQKGLHFSRNGMLSQSVSFRQTPHSGKCQPRTARFIFPNGNPQRKLQGNTLVFLHQLSPYFWRSKYNHRCGPQSQACLLCIFCMVKFGKYRNLLLSQNILQPSDHILHRKLPFKEIQVIVIVIGRQQISKSACDPSSQISKIYSLFICKQCDTYQLI